MSLIMQPCAPERKIIIEEKYSIKLLTANDIPLFKNLFVEVFTGEPWNDNWSDEEQLEKYFLDITDNKNSLTIGLFDGNDLNGIALGNIIHWCTGTEYNIREFCIKQNNQHKGLGSIFLNKIENYLKQNDINSIILSTDIETPAYYFYQKNEFKELAMHRFLHRKI